MKKVLALASMSLFLAASASFAKQALDEEEMDLVTAAGQPAVIIVEETGAGTVTINADEMGVTTLNVDTNSQTNLRAVALNNVAGENQIANAVNLQSGATSTTGTQSNTINQSWGSQYDWSFAPGATATATATATANVAEKPICVLADCEIGNATASADAAAAEAVPLSIHADKIIRVTNVGGTTDISQMDASVVTTNIETGSQVDLSGIAVNNVSGKNQVANAMNATANGSLQVNAAGIILDANVAGTAQYNGGQTNTINQYRGVPLNRVP